MTVKVSTDVHSRVRRLASELGASADEAIRLLVDPSTVRLPLSPEQHARWTAHARAAGLPLADWVAHQVEAVLTFGPQETINQIFYRVDALARSAGVTPPAPPRPQKKEHP
jgi:hypothetical protein